MLVEESFAFGRQAIELFRPLGRDAGVADFFEIGQRRVNHAGAGAVEAAGTLAQQFDEFIAVARLFLEQRQQQQLQFVAAEFAAGPKTGAIGAHAALEAAHEPAKAAPMSPAAELEKPLAMGVMAMLAVMSVLMLMISFHFLFARKMYLTICVLKRILRYVK